MFICAAFLFCPLAVQAIKLSVIGQGKPPENCSQSAAAAARGDDAGSRLSRIWTTTQLLANPKISRRFVAKTVANYALPESATEEIKSLPLDLLDQSA